MKKVSEIKKEWLLDNVNKLSLIGKSKADIARDLGFKPQYLNSLINGPRGITDQFMDKFIITFSLNQYALPESDVLLLNEPPSGYQEILHAKEETIETQRKYISHLEAELKKLEKEKPVENGQKRKVG